MREEVVENILTDNSKVPKHGSGVGVINVHNRIQLMFGEEYGLKVYKQSETATIASMIDAISNDKFNLNTGVLTC